jgi:hypothetical protein
MGPGDSKAGEDWKVSGKLPRVGRALRILRRKNDKGGTAGAEAWWGRSGWAQRTERRVHG